MAKLPGDKAPASYYHADTSDLERCQVVVDMVRSVIAGIHAECFPSENGREVIVCCRHSDALTRASAVMLVKQFLRRQPLREDYRYQQAHVIAFANEKGGVAKTTSCINLAACFALRGERTLVIDMDPQANATVGLGLEPAALDHQPQSLLLDSAFGLEQVISPTAIGNLDLVPANSGLAAANLELVKAVGRELKLRAKLSAYMNGPDAPAYRYILIDCPPAVDLITVNALMAATHMIVPVQPSYYSFRAMGLLSAAVAQLYDSLDPRVHMLGVLVTMYNKDEAAHRAMLELLRDRVSREFGPYVFPTQIRRAAAVGESEANQQPVVITHPRSSTARGYQSVADEIAERLAEVRYAA